MEHRDLSRDPPGDPPRDAVRAAVVFAVAAVFFALTALPGPHWHDTAEFAAVARRLSLSHSPGHPLHTLVTHGGWFFPLGDAGFRANLASGLAVAAALGLFYRLLRHLAPEAPWWGAFAAALLPAVLPAVWLQAARAEVYGLQILLSVVLALLCLRVARGEARALPLLAFAFGLAGANHTLIGVAMLPLALAAMAVGVRRWRPVLLAVPAGLAGLATYAYLVIRAGAGGEIGWGRPDTPAALWQTISGEEWMQVQPDHAERDLLENALRLAAWITDQVGPLAAALLGLVFAAGLLAGGRPALRRMAGPLLVAAAGFGTRFFATFDPLNPDLGGYWSVPLLALVALAWLGAVELTRHARLLAPATLPLALALVAPSFDPHHRMGARNAERMARAMLDEVPPEGALVYSDYSSNFLGWYLRAIEGARPDVALVFRGQLGREWHRARLATQAPRWAERLPGFPAGFLGPEVRFEPGVAGAHFAAVRPHLGAHGLTFVVGEPPASAAAVRARFAPALASPEADLDTRRSMGFLHAQHAIQHLFRLDLPDAPALARWHLERADLLAPGDPLLLDLATRLNALDDPARR